jgi:proteasome lid subunit RPN8/RPN11
MANFRAKTKTGPPSPLVRPRPAENDNFVAFSADGNGFSVYVHRDVLDFIERESRRAAPNEAIGLLAGRVCQDPVYGPYSLVMAADGARPGEVEASPSHVHISADGNASVRRRLEDAHPDREVIGWYHSHPRYPAQFSHVDLAEQSTWSDPHHVGIVFSGTETHEPFGVYRGPNAVRLTRSRVPAQVGVADSLTLSPSLRTEGAEPEPALAEQRRMPERPKLPVATITPNRRAPTTVITPSDGRDRFAPRLLLIILLLGLAIAVVWLHTRLLSIESALPALRNSTSASPGPVAPAQASAPQPSTTPTNSGAEADAAPVPDAQQDKQLNDAAVDTLLPVFVATPEVTPVANPLRERTSVKKKRRNKKNEKRPAQPTTPRAANR